jgi:hypothetical protein
VFLIITTPSDKSSIDYQDDDDDTDNNDDSITDIVGTSSGDDDEIVIVVDDRVHYNPNTPVGRMRRRKVKIYNKKKCEYDRVLIDDRYCIAFLHSTEEFFLSSFFPHRRKSVARQY